MVIEPCPAEPILTAFQLGDLPEPMLSQVAEHLDPCSRREKLAQVLDSRSDIAAHFLPNSGIRLADDWLAVEFTTNHTKENQSLN